MLLDARRVLTWLKGLGGEPDLWQTSSTEIRTNVVSEQIMRRKLSNSRRSLTSCFVVRRLHPSLSRRS